MYLRTAAIGSQEAGFTQPRDHSFAQLCIPFSRDCQTNGYDIGSGSEEGPLEVRSASETLFSDKMCGREEASLVDMGGLKSSISRHCWLLL